jgi:hypothetical protein
LLLQSAIFLATMILTINLVIRSLKIESVCFPSSTADIGRPSFQVHHSLVRLEG